MSHFVENVFITKYILEGEKINVQTNKKIALTGGPCAGKTTAIQEIEKEFTEKGYLVLIVPEAATILINSGVRPFGDFAINTIEFQKQVIKLQLTLESIADEVANQSNKPVIILCDRGVLDDKAYVTKKEWQQLLKEFKVKELDLMNRYNLTLHLRTAALGKEEFYTLDNNTARTETIEEARQKDKKTLEGWLGHENLKIIGNETSFNEKINQVIREIYDTLAKPYPTQIQRKYLIEKIDLSKIEEIKLVKLSIEQYMIESGNIEYIYRKTGKEEEEKYTLITKIDTDINNERITTRRLISEEEYYGNLSKEKPVQKTRYCFEYKNQYFRLDIFENGLQMLEIEPSSNKREITLPDFIKVEKEVTDDKEYRNSSIYKKLNKETPKTYQKV